MNPRPGRHAEATEADGAAEERDTIPAPRPSAVVVACLLDADADVDVDAGLDADAGAHERETVRPPRWHSDTAALFDATAELEDDEAEDYPLSLPPPPPLPGMGSGRPVAVEGEWEARATPLVNPVVTREEAFAERQDDLADAHNRVTSPGQLASPGGPALRSSALRSDDDPTVPRRPLEELIPPPPAGAHALDLASLAPIANTKPPPLPRIEGPSTARRAAILFAAAAVTLLAGTWLLRGPAPFGSDAPAASAARPGAAAAGAPVDAEPRNGAPGSPTERVEQDVAPTVPADAERAGSEQLAGPEQLSPQPGADTGADAELASALAPAPTASLRSRPRRRSTRGSPDPATLPEVPAREEVVAGLESLRAEVVACGQGRAGVAQVDLSIASTGRVAHAVVGGDFAGTVQGSCIARTLRRARFEPFRQARFRILYPFSL